MEWLTQPFSELFKNLQNWNLLQVGAAVLIVGLILAFFYFRYRKPSGDTEFAAKQLDRKDALEFALSELAKKTGECKVLEAEVKTGVERRHYLLNRANIIETRYGMSQEWMAERVSALSQESQHDFEKMMPPLPDLVTSIDENYKKSRERMES